MTNFTRNFVMSNYHSAWPFDHDDGSRYFHDENNFFVFGGSKNFMGSFKINANNWCVR